MYNLVPFYRHGANLLHFMNDIEHELFPSPASGKMPFRCDISEVADGYVLNAELPGFSKEDISIEVDDNRITVSAAHSAEKDESGENGSYIRRERHFGSFARSFSAEGIDAQRIAATYTNGVLTLQLPKVQPPPKTVHKIAIGEGAH